MKNLSHYLSASLFLGGIFLITLMLGCSAKKPVFAQGAPVRGGVVQESAPTLDPRMGSTGDGKESDLVYVSPYFDDQGKFLGTMVGGTFIPDGPGSPMIQSALPQLGSEGFWDGWFNFFSVSDREYAHVELMNGIIINAYAEYEKRYYENNRIKIHSEGDHYHEFVVGAPRSFSEFARYFIQATSVAQDMKVNVWSILAGYGMFESFNTINKSIDSVNAASGNAVDAGAAGFEAGAGTAFEGVGLGAGIAAP